MLGRLFNSWVVISRAENSKAGKVKWNCRCVCGTEKSIVGSDLRNGKSKSCRRCSASNPTNVARCRTMQPNLTTHGMSSTRIYNIWAGMLARCSDSGHKNYAGRGISVCTDWHTFEGFYSDMGSSYSDELTIDRVDNDGNYTVGNCRWATMSEQARNTRRNRILLYRGENKNLIEWCEELGIPYFRTKKRLNSGWSVKDAFEKPKHKNQNR